MRQPSQPFTFFSPTAPSFLIPKNSSQWRHFDWVTSIGKARKIWLSSTARWVWCAFCALLHVFLRKGKVNGVRQQLLRQHSRLCPTPNGRIFTGCGSLTRMCSRPMALMDITITLMNGTILNFSHIVVSELRTKTAKSSSWRITSQEIYQCTLSFTWPLLEDLPCVNPTIYHPPEELWTLTLR